MMFGQLTRCIENMEQDPLQYNPNSTSFKLNFQVKVFYIDLC
jgi:hypothetical protein